MKIVSDLSIKVTKIMIFVVSAVVLYLIMPSFIGIGLSNKCVFINFVVIIYVALAVLSLYEFYIGDAFTPGIQMYYIKSLDDDSSKLNIIHRRIGAVFVFILASSLLFFHVNGFSGC